MNTFAEIAEKIRAYNTIIIHRHESPDPDALGSQAGLGRAIEAAFPNKKVLLAGGPVGDLDWLSTMDTVTDEDYADALVIVVDTADTPRISDQRFNRGKFLIKIDHHPNDDPYGDMLYVQTEASSVSEIIADLINAEQTTLKLTKSAAAALYAGIVGDTGRFLYDATSAHTFDIAAQLVRTGIKHWEISQHMNEVTIEQARLQSAAYDLIKIDPSGAASLLITQKKLKELGIDEEQSKAVVSTPSHLKQVKAWVIFVEQPDGHYRVHFRSKGPIINQIAKAHNGGGHPLASGAKASDQAEIEQITQELIKTTKAFQAGEDDK